MSRHASSFTILTVFAIFIIAGLALIPLIPVQLKPNYVLPGVSVSFTWSNAQPRAIEQEVTSVLEGILSSLKEVKSVKSESGVGAGRITVEFNKNTDMDMARFEISSAIRRAYFSFPDGVSYPTVTMGGQSSGDKPVMVYTVSSDLPAQKINEIAENDIKEKLAQVKGVGKIKIYGTTPNEWLITYYPEKMQNVGIKSNDITTAISNYQKEYPIAQSKIATTGINQNIILQSECAANVALENLPVGYFNGRVILLGQIADITKQPQMPSSYFRVNGKNTIYMALFPQDGQNQIKLAQKIKKAAAEISALPGFPVSLNVNSDPTKNISSEITKNIWRMVATLMVLFIFVLLVSRNFKYLAVMVLSLLANISISFFFYYFTGIELHLFSFAGFTVSLGFLIDNSIVMTDHLMHKNNRKVFTALLASTLTTIAALTIVFFLDERTRLQLVDFAAVIIINLVVSLVIALFFIPALMEKISLNTYKGNHKKIKRKKKVILFTGKYFSFLMWLSQYKRWAFAIAIIGFGLPVFMLPFKLENRIGTSRSKPLQENWEQSIYNKTLGSDFYNEHLRSKINLVLGGALRLFMEKTNSGNYFAEPEQTRLDVNAQMPEGATLEQMNEVFIRLENYLNKFKEIDRFETNIMSNQEGELTITFKKDAEYNGFPEMLKELITNQAINITDADWNITGVGDGFNNSLTEQTGNYKVLLQGYNYEELSRIANRLRDSLMVNPRIQEVNIMGRDMRSRIFSNEYMASVNTELLSFSNIGISNVAGFLTQNTNDDYNAGKIKINGEFENIALSAAGVQNFDQWEFKHGVIGNSTRQIKLNDIAQVQKQRIANTIYKTNQQYQLVLEYDYIGTYDIGSEVLDKTLENFSSSLPLGYTAQELNRRSLTKDEKYTQLKLILIVLVIIYFLCAILFNSLWQSFAIILTIPISLIGVFLTFYFFDIDFGQGGFAAIILLSGLTVNAAIYIVNERNNVYSFYKSKSNSSSELLFKSYLKAFNTKIIPILLTILSTILGLVPFLTDGPKEKFWYSLAMGTSGGLIFSLICIYIYLPLFFLDNKIAYAKKDHLNKTFCTGLTN
jgi:multidrug efflux pump subunit AcrB